MACLLVGGVLASCAVLRPGFRAPVPSFAETPATTTDIADRLTQNQPPVRSFDATFHIAVRGGELNGRSVLRMRYRAPNDIRLDARQGGVVGYFLQVTQKGDEVGLYFVKNGQYFLGTLAELDAYPLALDGIRPVDLVRAVLVSQEAADRLRHMPAGNPLQNSPDHWILSVSQPGRVETYALRRSDGLVEEVRLFDEHAAVRGSVTYQRYDSIRPRSWWQRLWHLEPEDQPGVPDVILPSRFEMRLANSGTVLTAKLDKATTDIDFPEIFALRPPGNIQTRPLADFLERLEMEARGKARPVGGGR